MDPGQTTGKQATAICPFYALSWKDRTLQVFVSSGLAWLYPQPGIYPKATPGKPSHDFFLQDLNLSQLSLDSHIPTHPTHPLIYPPIGLGKFFLSLLISYFVAIFLGGHDCTSSVTRTDFWLPPSLQGYTTIKTESSPSCYSFCKSQP